jgi:hypothetical protein
MIDENECQHSTDIPGTTALVNDLHLHNPFWIQSCLPSASGPTLTEQQRQTSLKAKLIK